MSKVYLVGAGPGDPALITWKGRCLIERADTILYDHLANESLLAAARASAERIYVGKKKAEHAVPQDEICRMMVEKVRAGRNVVRLKGGDPLLFGRGGEEAEVLARAGVEFEIVPGVTTALGIAAYSGIPLTHRDYTQAVTFVTGHDPDKVDWKALAGRQTVVIYMGVTTIGEIARRLIEAGRPVQTPAAAVRWATRPDQQALRSTLGEIAADIERAHLRPPATIVIGEAVNFGASLNWFERLPLFGRRIVVTRAQGQAADFVEGLRALGAAAVEFPTIAIRPASDYSALDRAIADLASYDWVVFTSANGVRHFVERLDQSQTDLRSLRGRVCAIGPATAEAIARLHVKVDLVPQEYVAESLIAAFANFDLEGKRVLLPRAAVARDVLPAALRERGAVVDIVEAYRTEVPEFGAEHAREVFSHPAHWITFTSSSTVKNFLALAGRTPFETARVASIGPVTSEVLRKHGIEFTVEAKRYTTAGLTEAIVEYELRSRPRS